MSESAGKAAAGGAVRRLGVEVQGRIDGYLAKVDAALARRRVGAADRRTQVLAMRTRILAELSAKAGDRPATAADAAAVLTALGPAESHAHAVVAHGAGAAAAHAGPRGKPRLASLASAGLICLCVFLLCVAAMVITARSSTPPPLWFARANWLVAIAAPLASTVLGLLAIGQIQNSNGMRYGLSLALFDALLFPLLLLDIFIAWSCWQFAASLIQQDVMSVGTADALVGQIVPVVACILLDYYAATRSWRIVQTPPPE